MRTLMIACTLVLFAGPAAAGSEVDPRWVNWLGCWELVTDDERADGPAPAAAAIDRMLGVGSAPAHDTRRQDETRPRLCVAPDAHGGVTLTTTAGGAVVHEQTITADGVERALAGACGGTTRAEWSREGSRLFSHAELTCAGEPTRAGTSLTLIAPDGSWLDIEAVREGARESLRVRRYRRVDDTLVRSAPRGDRLTLADVQEASTRVPPAVIEAALVETHAGFDLNGRDVVALADAGVPDRIIDLMVALSYPDKFIVERRAQFAASPISPFFQSSAEPWRYDAWRYQYAPFGYSSLDYYSSYDTFFPVASGLIVVGGGGSGGTFQPRQPPLPSAGAHAVNDLGYTRVRPREADTATPVRSRPMSTMTGNAPDTRVISATSPGRTDSGSDGGGGGSSVSPQGYSGGGSGGDSGRTAVPR